MLTHILVATDLSHRAEAAIARSAELAARFTAQLTLLHVVDQDQPERFIMREIELTQELLDEEAKRLKAEAGIDVKTVAVAGDPIDKIGEVASEVGADLIILGSHRVRPLRDLFVGTTVERVIWRGTHPVLMVKRTPAGQYSRIVVATDCSRPSATALRASKAIGLLADARVTVIHAVEPFAKTMLAAHANQDAVQVHVNAELRDARGKVSRFLEENGHADLVNRLHVDEGEPLEVLRAFIDLQKSDLIVMGTHGRSAIVRLVLGSVAETVMGSLDVDILSVPPKA
jgi:universal stress protein E